MNIIPSSMKQGQKVRSLSNTIKPLLIRQQTRILRYIRLLWPHFLQEDYRLVRGFLDNIGKGRIHLYVDRIDLHLFNLTLSVLLHTVIF